MVQKNKPITIHSSAQVSAKWGSNLRVNLDTKRLQPPGSNRTGENKGGGWGGVREYTFTGI